MHFDLNEIRQFVNRRTKLSIGIALLGIVIIVISFSLISHLNKKVRLAKATPVVLTAAKTSDVPVYLNALGGVTPTYSVTVRTQINGTLLYVLYHEGQMVKKNELLAQIDPRIYESQLIQYQGQLTRDSALLTNALIDLHRYQTLWKQDSVSQQTLATQESLVKQYQGAVAIDQGLIKQTQVNLIYCRISAPIDGRIGLRLVDPGNVVQTSDSNGIAVINTLSPITVVFSIPEDNIPEILQQIDTGKKISVQAYNREQSKLLATGILLTIDNQIDPSTGTVKLKAQFDNKDNRLFPSQFVNIRMLVKTLLHAVIIPTSAIQFSQKGPLVYVYNHNATVTQRKVATGITEGLFTTISSGLRPGEQVVTEGTDSLSDGAKVAASDDKQGTLTQPKNQQRERKSV